MLIDKVKINIKSGNGGNGCVSFRRAKYVPRGGPDGGDGGKGGDVLFIASSKINSLSEFRYKKNFIANSGSNGSKKNCTGKDAKDLIIKIPVGTVIREANSQKIIADMWHEGKKKIIAKGGKGGRGNQHFATAKIRAPRYAEQGGCCEEYDLILELKLIADVGLIGEPNVGKSSLLNAISNTHAKVADYKFTTLEPNLGVINLDKNFSFVAADIPGLIEGASNGLGLGHEFLKHAERTKIFWHVIDLYDLNFELNIKKINRELELYNKKLLDKKQIIVGNKLDLICDKNLFRLKKFCEQNNFELILVSAMQKINLKKLISRTASYLSGMSNCVEIFQEEYFKTQKDFEPGILIEKLADKYFKITGRMINKLLGYNDLNSKSGREFLEKYLHDKKIIELLKEHGWCEGDVIKIGDYEFKYYLT